MIKVTIINKDESRQEIEIPTENGISLMEVLKTHEYNIPATCGGIALCATCHVEVVDGIEQLPQAKDDELNMLDILPNADNNSRLSCQLRVDEHLDGIIVRIKGTNA